jgi:hypothetical protein
LKVHVDVHCRLFGVGYQGTPSARTKHNRPTRKLIRSEVLNVPVKSERSSTCGTNKHAEAKLASLACTPTCRAAS